MQFFRRIQKRRAQLEGRQYANDIIDKIYADDTFDNYFERLFQERMELRKQRLSQSHSQKKK